jgi:hypothetical protein
MYDNFIIKSSDYISNYYISKKNNNNEIITLLKPEYILYFRIYIIYLFLYYFKKKYMIDYSLCLQGQYIIHEIYKNVEKKIAYKSKYDICFLNEITNNSLFYLINTILYFDKKIAYYHKLFIFGNIGIFYSINKVNEIHKKRLYCIEKKKDFKDPLKILIFSPNSETIKNIIDSTNIFNLFHFYVFINIIFILFY